MRRSARSSWRCRTAKLSVDAASNHARCGTILAKINDKATFDIIEVTKPVDPIAGCTL